MKDEFFKSEITGSARGRIEITVDIRADKVVGFYREIRDKIIDGITGVIQQFDLYQRNEDGDLVACTDEILGNLEALKMDDLPEESSVEIFEAENKENYKIVRRSIIDEFGQWTLCSKALPDSGAGPVLVTLEEYVTGERRVSTAENINGRWYADHLIPGAWDPIAWMPLPAPIRNRKGGQNEKL